MKQISNVTIGSDPEMFIINGTTGKVVSSVGMIPGQKGNPWLDQKWLEPEFSGFGLETDNILAEFNIPPVKNKEDFIRVHNYMKDYIRAFVQKINPQYDILCAASMLVDEDQLQSDQAREFGWQNSRLRWKHLNENRTKTVNRNHNNLNTVLTKGISKGP